jgi:thiol:disulfide interchange protein DsbD
MIAWLVASFLIWLAGINLQKQLKTLFVVLVGGLTLLIVDFDLKEKESIQLTSSETWSKERVAGLRENKESYFINFTAAWCITCQVNEGIALTPRVIAEMDSKSITYLKADWTNRNREILDELKLFNRTGIPVYIFWREGMEYPIILNEVLTEQYLMEIFNEI